MVRLDRVLRRRGLKPQIAMLIHEALRVESTNEEESEFRRLLRMLMNSAAKLDLQLELDFS
jgi:DNA polymerase I-like protein with 3'-5' exonuclease and polymerase domains